MTNISKPAQLKLLLDSIDYPHLMEFEDSFWYIDQDEVHWNQEDNLLDLYSGDGETCSGELSEGVAEWEGYTICNYNEGSGTMVTMLLSNEKQVTVEQLESLV